MPEVRGSAASGEAGDERGVDAVGHAVRGGEDQVAVRRVAAPTRGAGVQRPAARETPRPPSGQVAPAAAVVFGVVGCRGLGRRGFPAGPSCCNRADQNDRLQRGTDHSPQPTTPAMAADGSWARVRRRVGPLAATRVRVLGGRAQECSDTSTTNRSQAAYQPEHRPGCTSWSSRRRSCRRQTAAGR